MDDKRAELVAHWWNRRYGFARLDIWVHRLDGRWWTVTIRAGVGYRRPGGDPPYVEARPHAWATEQLVEMRRWVASLIRARPAQWINLVAGRNGRPSNETRASSAQTGR